MTCQIIANLVQTQRLYIPKLSRGTGILATKRGLPKFTSDRLPKSGCRNPSKCPIIFQRFAKSEPTQKAVKTSQNNAKIPPTFQNCQVFATEFRQLMQITDCGRQCANLSVVNCNAIMRGVTTILVYDERVRFRKVPTPTARHPVPSILTGRVRAGKARIVKYVITLDEDYRLRAYDWSALLRKRTI
jgi:hypothetical protein